MSIMADQQAQRQPYDPAMPPGSHMTPDEFRRAGHDLVDWIASYLEGIEGHPVLSRVAPGEVRSLLPAHPPATGEPFGELLADVESIILPGITHWQSPSFFGFFPANASEPAVLGELLSAGLGIQGMLWATSPAATELETLALDWLAEMAGLPDGFRSTSRGGGVIQGSASEATLVAILAARERATHLASNRHGAGGDLVAYTSTEGHSSVEKAVRIAGLGSSRLRMVAVDESFAMDPDDLERQVIADRAEGLTPTVVVATIGTTSSTAIDPIRAIGEICRAHGVWLHVDAAYAGTAAICPEFRWIQDGLELADSYCFNPHKGMLTNFDCTAFWVADRDHLVQTLTVVPEYLRNRASAAGEVIDYRDWQIPLGRRFRALKLWFVIRHYGVEGLQRYVRGHIALAQEFAGWVEAHPDFEVAAPHPLSLVCFRHTGGDRVNQRIMDEVNTSGEAYLTHTRLGGALTLRMAIGGSRTERHHVERAWEAITRAATG
jgi:aromatic-L-amino-acid/L-tryptophan decarboxylase